MMKGKFPYGIDTPIYGGETFMYGGSLYGGEDINQGGDTFVYRSTSLIGTPYPLGPIRRAMPRALWGS